MQSSLLKYKASRVERRPPRGERSATSSDTKTNARALSARTKRRSGFDGTGQDTAEDIIDSILPPREWTENGEVWVQRVSSTPATTADVLTLEAELDKRLKLRRARSYGLCPIREELYSQCFDELLRQVTIQCAERGLLLNRVRGELSSLLNLHHRLFESAAAFGVRTALSAEQRKTELEEEANAAANENTRLVEQIEQATQQLNEVDMEYKRVIELFHTYRNPRTIKSLIEKKDHEAAVANIRRKTQKVKHELERILCLATPT